MTPDVADSAEHTARKAASHPAFRTLARTGYAANGVVHLLIGAIILAAGAGGGESDQTGAFRAIAEAPLGSRPSGCSRSVWPHSPSGTSSRAFWSTRSDPRKRWAKRVGEWAKAIVYAAMAYSAASVALGTGSSGDQSAQNASSTVLSLPGGPVLLGAAGVVIVVIGGVFAAKGATRSFREKLRMPGGTTGKIVTVLGVLGLHREGRRARDRRRPDRHSGGAGRPG